jgi:hypothetical protein
MLIRVFFSPLTKVHDFVEFYQKKLEFLCFISKFDMYEISKT